MRLPGDGDQSWNLNTLVSGRGAGKALHFISRREWRKRDIKKKGNMQLWSYAAWLNKKGFIKTGRVVLMK